MKILVSLSFVFCLYLVFFFPLVFTFARLIGQEWKCSTRERIFAYVIVFGAIFASIAISEATLADEQLLKLEIALLILNVFDILKQVLIKQSFKKEKEEVQ